MNKRNLMKGTSGDALLLTAVKLMTIALSFVVTRLLSQHLSLHDYGTYSQILLLVSTVSSLTILGMMDGVNYYYCGEADPDKRDGYVATLFAMQGIASLVAGVAVLLLTGPISAGFDNPDLCNLMIFAAALPMLQNLMNMLQVLLVSVGKAKVLALRNLLVSVVRLAVVLLMVLFVRNVAVILTATLVMDVLQVLFFGIILKQNSCAIRLGKADLHLVGQILQYCIPMAMFILMRSINRDLDKYMIGLWTDTETLAVYTNASKPLPFDIILHSFITVLVPKVTRLVASGKQEKAADLYKGMLELGCLTTVVPCFAALAAAPQLMELLYSDKYSSGLSVFCLYILVDLLQFVNMTMVLCAAGKTGTLMLVGVGTLGLNAVLNGVLYSAMGIAGPALATLIVTFVSGVLIMGLSAKSLGTGLLRLFDWPFLAAFLAANLAAVALLEKLQWFLRSLGVHYMVILVVVAGVYAGAALILCRQRIRKNISVLNRTEE